MRKTLNVFIFLIILTQQLFSKDDPQVSLSIIFQNNKYGFIDSTGKIIIEPVFANATEFSEGLAAARINSKYGFINGTGEFVIEPKYEFAEEFKNGVALVYIDTIPAFLFKDGRELKFENYKKIRFFEKDRAYARTYSKKEGVINTEGTLIIDTLYEDLSFRGKFGLAYIRSTDSLGKYESKKGCINDEGKVVVPFGVFKNINHFKRGCAKVEIKNTKTQYNGYVNEEGRLVISDRKLLKTGRLKDCVNDSTFIVRFDDKQSGESKYGLVNSNGSIIASHKNWEYIKLISKNLCSVSLYNESKEILIDATGKQVINTKYDLIYSEKDLDENKYFVIRNNNKYALLDFDLKFIIPFQQHRLDLRDVGENYFIYEEEEDGTRQYGMNDFKGNVIIPPGNYSISNPEFVNGLVLSFDSNYTYLNRKGVIVWEGQYDKQEYSQNIDYMCLLYYKPDSSNDNFFFSESSGENNILNSTILLSIEKQDTVVKYRDANSTFKGLLLKITNGFGMTLIQEFLSIKLQAKDENDNCRYIEDPEMFILGAGHGRVETKTEFLPDKSWNFIIPEFEGDLKTVMRAEFILKNSDGIESRFYSNEVNCNINPQQFWRKEYW